MLILNRRPEEQIRINEEITITLLSINGKQAKIGISAPANISVHREEIYQKIQQEKLQAEEQH